MEAKRWAEEHAEALLLQKSQAGLYKFFALCFCDSYCFLPLQVFFTFCDTSNAPVQDYPDSL